MTVTEFEIKSQHPIKILQWVYQIYIYIVGTVMTYAVDWLATNSTVFKVL